MLILITSVQVINMLFNRNLHINQGPLTPLPYLFTCDVPSGGIPAPYLLLF